MQEIKEEIKICFRFLEQNELYKLDKIYKDHNDIIPNPNLSYIYVAELEDGEIIAFCAFVLTPFITMWISEEYRGNGLWKEMVEGIMPFTEKAKTYVIATRVETQEMCLRLGLRLIESPVFVKDVL